MINIIFIGDTFVGKTSLIQFMFHQKTFGTSYLSTLGVQRNEITIDDKTLSLYDCGGNERFANICEPYYKYAHFAVIVFDASTPYPDHWVAKWKTYDKPYVVVANSMNNQPSPNIDNTIYTNCATGDGIQELMEQILDVEGEETVKISDWTSLLGSCWG
jgi:GTPase SAR1 family protein